VISVEKESKKLSVVWELQKGDDKAREASLESKIGWKWFKIL